MLIVGLLVLLILFSFSCAKNEQDSLSSDNNVEDAAASNEYSPEVVDNLTNDIDNMRW